MYHENLKGANSYWYMLIATQYCDDDDDDDDDQDDDDHHHDFEDCSCNDENEEVF